VFEIIGLLLGFAVCMTLGLVVSGMLGAIAWLLSRRLRIFLTAFAIALPPLCVVYLFVCGALLPHESLFGDISQPLPNGYYIRALGKMPDFAGIGWSADISSNEISLTECIGSLAVYDSFVVGRYSHPYATFDPHPNEAYFLFDTKTATHKDFPTLAALEASIGHPVSLVEVQYFRSQEPEYLHQKRLNELICFGPMFIALVTMILFTRYNGIKADKSPMHR
jgi:hypothetical protein